MDPRIETRKEAKRGCGFRNKKGALYLVDLDTKNFKPCGKLPFNLGPCPCCGEGIKPSRQWVWIEADKVLSEAKAAKCKDDRGKGCACPLDSKAEIGRAGLIWVGEKFYDPPDFLYEASKMGFSRRIAFVPKGFEVGKTWVFLGHIRAKDGKPGIVGAYIPKAVEVICDGTETEAEVDGYLKRGLTPVKVDNGQPVVQPEPPKRRAAPAPAPKDPEPALEPDDETEDWPTEDELI